HDRASKRRLTAARPGVPLPTGVYDASYLCLWPPAREPCSVEEQRNSYAREACMSAHNKLRKYLYSSFGPALLAAMSLATIDGGWAACVFPPPLPATTQTKCLTAVTIIPGNPLRSFDISWVNPDRAEYYLADRSNAGIDVIDTQTLKFKRTIGGFVGVVLNGAGTPGNNKISGPHGGTYPCPGLYPPA